MHHNESLYFIDGGRCSFAFEKKTLKFYKINKIQFSHTFFGSLFLRCSEHWVGEQREFWEFRPLRHTVVKYIDKKGEQKMHVALKETWPSLSFDRAKNA